MAKYYVVDATPAQWNGYASKVLITVNTALTGNIKVIDGTAGSTANVAVITNPTVGSMYEYWDFSTGVRVIASTTCDVTVSVTDRQMA